MKPTPRQLSAGALIALGTPLIAAPAWATPGNADNVTFCHATASHTNPYVTITTDPKSFFQQGHDSHEGPVWTPKEPRPNEWGDIVPPFHYSYEQGQQTVSGDYPGKNWSSDAEAMWAAGCQPSPPVAPTPSSSATPTASVTPTITPSVTPTETSASPGKSTSPEPTVTAQPEPGESSIPPSARPTVSATAPGVRGPGRSPSPETSVLGTKFTRIPSAAPAASRLPHTGLPVWPLTILGLGLVGVGAALLRRPHQA